MSSSDSNGHSLVLEPFSGFAISLNCVVFSYDGLGIKVLLIKEPELSDEVWALPGDGLKGDESFDEGAQRIMLALNGQPVPSIDQRMVGGELEHFQKGSLLTIAFFSTVSTEIFKVSAEFDTRSFHWWYVDDLPEMIEAHSTLIEESFKRLQWNTRTKPLGFYLLNNKFTIFQLQKLFETVLITKYDRPNFRRKILATGLLQPLEIMEEDVRHRPAKMFRFDVDKYLEMRKKGFELSF